MRTRIFLFGGCSVIVRSDLITTNKLLVEVYTDKKNALFHGAEFLDEQSNTLYESNSVIVSPEKINAIVEII